MTEQTTTETRDELVMRLVGNYRHAKTQADYATALLSLALEHFHAAEKAANADPDDDELDAAMLTASGMANLAGVARETAIHAVSAAALQLSVHSAWGPIYAEVRDEEATDNDDEAATAVAVREAALDDCPCDDLGN